MGLDIFVSKTNGELVCNFRKIAFILDWLDTIVPKYIDDLNCRDITISKEELMQLKELTAYPEVNYFTSCNEDKEQNKKDFEYVHSVVTELIRTEDKVIFCCWW